MLFSNFSKVTLFKKDEEEPTQIRRGDVLIPVSSCSPPFMDKTDKFLSPTVEARLLPSTQAESDKLFSAIVLCIMAAMINACHYNSVRDACRCLFWMIASSIWDGGLWCMCITERLHLYRDLNLFK